MENNSLENKLEAWLDDLLPEEAAAEIQHLVETDPDTLKMLDMVKARRAVVDQIQAGHYQEKLKIWEKSAKAPDKGKRWIWWGATAIVSVLLGIFFIEPYRKPEEPVPEKPTQLVEENPPQNILAPVDSISSSPRTATNKQMPKVVLRYLSMRPYDLKDRELNFVLDTLDSPAEEKESWVEVKDGLYISNEVPPEEAYEIGSSLGPTRGGSEKAGSDYDRGIDSLKVNPPVGVSILSIIPNNDREYELAQKALAFYFLRQKDYSKAIAHFEQYHKIKPFADEGWMMIGFYLLDYPKYRKKVADLLSQMTLNPEHKYYKKAKELKTYLHIKG